MATLDKPVCRLLLAEARVARLATVGADGAPHVVPCCFAVDGDRLYSVVDGKPKSTNALRRLDNVAANQNVSLVVDHYEDDWTELWWVRVDATAAVIGEGSGDTRTERVIALGLLAEKYPQYRVDPPVGAVLRLDISRLVGWAFDPAKVAPAGQPETGG